MKLIPQNWRGVVWWKFRNLNFNRFWLIHPCDRQTDGQTDEGTIAYSSMLSIYAIMLSRAKNVQTILPLHNVSLTRFAVVGVLVNSDTAKPKSGYERLDRLKSLLSVAWVYSIKHHIKIAVIARSLTRSRRCLLCDHAAHGMYVWDFARTRCEICTSLCTEANRDIAFASNICSC